MENSENNETNNERQVGRSLVKLLFYVVIFVAWLLVSSRSCVRCGSSGDDSSSSSQSVSSQWVGTYEQSPWKFVLRKDGSATVRSSEDHEYETTWEDGGNWAVVGAYNGEVFLIDNNGNLSTMGKDGHKTGLFKLKKTK
ncbi:MAG: hypothetical protein K6G25_04800 [Bacteroidales bacterium]|nr:hypothetical protein [Bacteroidales bacterium]